MKTKSTPLFVIALAFSAAFMLQFDNPASAQDAKVYELRTYTTAPGRLQALLDRFGGGEVDLFIKHGMTSVGYWVPDDEELSQNTLVYMVAHASREAATASWSAFGADPDWHVMRDKSRESGPIVTGVTVQFLDPTSFSPSQ